MNFVNGKIISNEECDTVLENIGEMLITTLQKPLLDTNIVINACDILVKNISNLKVIKKLPEMGISPRLAEIYISQISHMLSAEAIKKRLEIELSPPSEIVYLHSKARAYQHTMPLGVLLHITAGNVDVLPFVSLLEGLICGNINIVKLPGEDQGITVMLLEELFEIAPSLKEYVYIFDYSSKDIVAMKRLAEVADAIVVWGGDEAVRAVRTLAHPNTRIIEWGHKISFAYVTKASNSQLEDLALNICLTNQLFCSSCQGVFLDTNDMHDVYNFCQQFLPVLEKVSEENPFAFSEQEALFTSAKVTLELYNKQIESMASGTRVFKGKNCSITANENSALEASIMYRNIWVKPLKRENILTLRRYKNHLQTAALICSKDDYGNLADKLHRAGIVKICDGLEMSNHAFGEAHDGVFTLRCYTKLSSLMSM